MFSTKHWGEIDSNKDEIPEIPDVTEVIKESMNMCCLDAYQDDKEPIVINKDVVIPPMDPLVMYAISLHKYINEINRMTDTAPEAIEANLIVANMPPMPEMPDISLKHKRNCLNYIPMEISDFTLGKKVNVPHLSDKILRKLLEKCVAVMFAHIGFETCTQSAMDVLVDVLETFMLKICSRIVETKSIDEESPTTFPHYIEQVLTELGLGGVKSLHDFYQTRVIKYIDVLLKRCQEVNDNYEAIIKPNSTEVYPETGQYYSEVKVKEEVQTEDNSQTYLSQGDTLLVSFSQLGDYEQDGQIQNIPDVAENEEITSSSPDLVYITENEQTGSEQPCIKRKR